MSPTLSPTQRQLAQLGLAASILIPIGLWFSSQPLTIWSTTPGALRSIGHLCGLVGATLFSYNFILAARISWVEEILNGLPKVYTLHHLFGGLAFILLLVHPVFLGLQYLSYSVSTAASFYITIVHDLPKLLGLLAWATLVGLLIITFFIQIAYHHWKATHQWLGLALVLASLHVYLIPGHLDSAPWLRGYMVTLMAAGLAAFAYRVLGGRWLVRRYVYRVDSVKVHNQLATKVRLRPARRPISYKAGQFFFMRVHTQNGITKEAHPFSFTSSPTQSPISFAAKIAGDYTSTLSQLRPGMVVDIEGPYGRFLQVQANTSQVWVAGGIGITPFMSRARELSPSFNGKIHLYYVVRNKRQALFAQELAVIARAIPRFKLSIWSSRTRGQFTVKNITEVGQPDVRYFICGPNGMMTDLHYQLRLKNTPKWRIHTEEFKLY